MKCIVLCILSGFLLCCQYGYWPPADSGLMVDRLIMPVDQGDADFGHSIAMQAEWCIVGASSLHRGNSDSDDSRRQGGAFVFRREAGGWRLHQLLQPDGLAAGDHFGISIAISGEYAAIGAFARGGLLGCWECRYQGCVFVFKRKADENWVLHQTLEASDMPAGISFGSRIAMAGTAMVIGAASGDFSLQQAYVFELEGEFWREVAILRPESDYEAAAFGCSVAVQGPIIVVGAMHEDTELNQRGAAYVFQRVGGTWNLVQRIVAPLQDAGFAPRFLGRAVAILGESILIAERPGYSSDKPGHGVVRCYRSIEGTWTQVQELSSTYSGAYQQFCDSMAVDGEYLVLSADMAGPVVYRLSEVGFGLARDFTNEIQNNAESYYRDPVAISGRTIAFRTEGRVELLEIP